MGVAVARAVRTYIDELSVRYTKLATPGHKTRNPHVRMTHAAHWPTATQRRRRAARRQSGGGEGGIREGRLGRFLLLLRPVGPRGSMVIGATQYQ